MAPFMSQRYALRANNFAQTTTFRNHHRPRRYTATKKHHSLARILLEKGNLKTLAAFGESRGKSQNHLKTNIESKNSQMKGSSWGNLNCFVDGWTRLLLGLSNHDQESRSASTVHARKKRHPPKDFWWKLRCRWNAWLAAQDLCFFDIE